MEHIDKRAEAMKHIDGKAVTLQDGELRMKEGCNREYLMELRSAALLQNYYQEAGLHQNFGSKEMAHGGWEDPSCQLRGHFLGHWLSAAALHYCETGDEELRAKADAIVHELKICQQENGEGWAASIPEKYFRWIAKGKSVWAPHYTVHKTFMGLLDMYRYAGNEEALEVAKEFSLWFDTYTKDKTREEMDNILDFETGGMLEIWADLYEFTGQEVYLKLIERYDRHRLFDALLRGEDALTNMHANTTIPEAIGCARVYEVTGRERYRDIALAYWKQAVTERGTFATGGQTCGEIWTPKRSMAQRLGDKNQEHCTVYNMIRLAHILFTWTGEAVYQDYIEKNLYNGILSQGYFRGGHANGQTPEYPEEGLITYFQPLQGGRRKGWGSKTGDFFCCHGTLVQANAAHNRYLYYQKEDEIYVTQYFASTAHLQIGEKKVTLIQYRDTLSGNAQEGSNNTAEQKVQAMTRRYVHQPDCMLQCFKLDLEGEAEFSLCFRIPEWVKGTPVLTIDQETIEEELKAGSFFKIRRVWKKGDEVKLLLPLSVYTVPLEGREDMVAFLYGPIVLAGLCDAERTLYTGSRRAEELLVHDNEREWGFWKMSFKTRYQDPGICFLPLYQIGYEKYQVYFPVQES